MQFACKIHDMFPDGFLAYFIVTSFYSYGYNHNTPTPLHNTQTTERLFARTIHIHQYKHTIFTTLHYLLSICFNK